MYIVYYLTLLFPSTILALLLSHNNRLIELKDRAMDLPSPLLQELRATSLSFSPKIELVKKTSVFCWINDFSPSHRVGLGPQMMAW
jgi:hypothetical protein